MMTTYKNTNYETTEALRNALNTELAALAYPFTVKHKINGEGQLTSVKAPLTGNSLFVTVDFGTIGTKTLALDMLLAHRLLEMPEALMEVLLEAQTAFKADFEANQTAHIAAERQAREEAKAAKKKAEEEKKATEKYEQMKAKALKDFEALTKTKKTFTEADGFYYTLGWLARHVGTISAAMPDYLENAFISYFGADTPHRAVDSKKKTINGYPTQWAMSFKASLPRVDCIPATLTQYLNPTGNAVTNTAFIWDLIDNYGFSFGKKQNKEIIESYIPTQCLDSFEEGWNA
jgi:hypothetical protein